MKRFGFVLGLIWCLTACEEPTMVPPPTIIDQPLTIDARGAAWVAVQDGDGPWTFLGQHEALEPTSIVEQRSLEPDSVYRKRVRDSLRPQGDLRTQTEGVYVIALQDEAGRYAVANVCIDPDDNIEVWIEHGTSAEDDRLFAGCFTNREREPVPSYTVRGEVTGLTPTTEIAIEMGPENAQFGLPDTSYSLTLEPELYDLIALRRNPDNLLPDSIIFRPNLYVDADRSVDLDFEGVEAFTPDYFDLNIETADPAQEALFAAVSLYTENGTHIDMGTSESDGLRYAAFPDSLGTVEYDAFADHFTSSGDRFGSESSFLTVTEASDLRLRLPKPLGNVSLSSDLSLSWPLYDSGWEHGIRLEQEDDAREREYDIELSAGWLGDTTTYAVPDFRELENWLSDWSLGPNVETEWRLSVHRGRASEGGRQSASQSGTLTPTED